MKKNNFLTFLFALLLFTTTSNAQIITFDFDGGTGDEVTVNSNSNDANLNIATISRGSGVVAAGNTNRFNGNNWNTGTLTDAIAGNDYMEFTINPKTSYEFSVSSIEVKLQRSDVGPLAVSLRSSVDSYSTTLDTEKILVDDESIQIFTFTFTQAAKAVPVTYRFYMYNAETESNKIGFEGSGNDIIVNGTVALTAKPTVGFQNATSSETETDATFTSSNIPVVVTNYPGSQIDINISVTGGTAEAGDYSFTSPTSLSFTENGTKNITVDINNDADVDDETIIFTLTETSSVSGLVISEATHTLTITDDEVPVAPSAGTVFFTEFVNSDSGSNNDYLELFNNSANIVTLSTCKVVFYSPSDNTTVELVYDFGVDGDVSTDILIPAYGFLILTKGNNRANFNSSNSITLGSNVNLNAGNGNPGTRTKFQLKLGGTADTNDGTLIDDTGVMTAGNKKYRNIFNKEVVIGLPADQTPGTLEYLVYSGGAWLNSEVLDGTTATKDAFVYDNLTISANSSINNLGISSDKNVTLNSGFSLATTSITINSGGSFIASGTSTVTGNATYIRALGTTNWYLTSSPVSGEIMTDMRANNSFANGTGGNRIGFAAYNDSNAVNSKWEYFTSSSTDALTNGKGYSAKLASTGNLSYTGTINTTDITATVSSSGNGFNLIGNPYTSHMNSKTFLDANTNLDQTQLWVWNQASGASGMYEVKTNASATILAPTQGFFVKANSGNQVSFAESNQVGSGGTFQRSALTKLKLVMTDGESNRFAKIHYSNLTTKGFDAGWEGEVFGGIPNSLDVFTHLVEGNQGKKYQVQCLPNSELESVIIPVGVIAEAGKELTFSIETANFPSDVNVYLEDRVNKTFNELTYDKTFKITLEKALNDVGRFYVHTSKSALSVELDLDLAASISIFKSSPSTLKLTALPNGSTTLKLFNLLGKQLISTTFYATRGTKEIELPRLAKGIYIVQLATQAGNVNKKIVLE